MYECMTVWAFVSHNLLVSTSNQPVVELLTDGLTCLNPSLQFASPQRVQVHLPSAAVLHDLLR